MQSRREFIASSLKAAAVGGAVCCGVSTDAEAADRSKATTPVELEKFRYGFLVDITKCIGCGSCVRACRKENVVPKGNFRTWIERYTVERYGEVNVDSPGGGEHGFEEFETDSEPVKAFFVPKLCNQCSNTPCVQVCPVGATFLTPDGFVLIDRNRCVGCAYCVHSCPYGARYLNHATGVADKCTWCYHRIVKGLQPACVGVCPTGARVFGDTHDPKNPLDQLTAENAINVLKPDLGTNPKTQYIGLTKEVR